MHRGRETRLARFRHDAARADDALSERRRTLRARAAIGAAVRRSLTRAGLDPNRAPALRVADEAAAELAALGDDAAAQSDDRRPPAVERGAPSGAGSGFDERMARLVDRYRDSGATAPDLAQASLAELFAWCLARADSAGST
jgi:hypothetical protein